SKNNIDLEKYSEIIVGCAHNFFGIYLVAQNIEFTFLEDASGLLSRPNILRDIEKGIYLSKHHVCEKFGLYDGNNGLITKKICNFNTQVEGFSESDIEHFDVVKELGRLDHNIVNNINRFFGVKDKYFIDDRTCV